MIDKNLSANEFEMNATTTIRDEFLIFFLRGESSIRTDILISRENSVTGS